jgi:uncharacterized membrane protein
MRQTAKEGATLISDHDGQREERDMATFTVWKFDDVEAADQAALILKRAESDGLVKVVDHAVVTWPEGESRPKSTHSNEDKWRGTGWGAFLGALVGMLFFMPVLGAGVGAAIGRWSKSAENTGVTKEQLERIRSEITPGTSALFAVTDQADRDRLAERFHGVTRTLVETNLTEAERSVLLEEFGGSEAVTKRS